MSNSMLQLQLEVRFGSDWHVGHGAGQPGHIDRLVRRAANDGLPYLPAKTLTGLWRDGCEAIALGLDGRPGNWSRLVEIIFGEEPERRQRARSGTPLHAGRLSIRAGVLPNVLRAHLTANPALREALTFIKPGIEIHRDTGQALDDHLRFEEVVRAGALLTSEVSLDTARLHSPQVEALLALLWAGAKAVERIGGKRRRGLGRCTLQFSKLPVKPETVLRVLAADAPAVPPCEHAPAPAVDLRAASRVGAIEWVAVPLTLRLRTPVIVPAQTLGNVVTSLDFVPGTYLLGHVSRVLGPLLGDFFRAVAHGDVCVSHAYVELGGQRSLPMPFSLHYAKERGGLEHGQPVWNFLAEDDPRDEEQRKQYRGGYLARANTGQLAFRRTPVQQTTHNTIDDEPQRPTQAVGGVFTYEAIRAGTTLRAELRMRRALADALPPDWWQRLSCNDVRLGIAKKDDYGLVELEAGECAHRRSDAQIGTSLVLWLLSDLLLRDEQLAATAAVEVLTRQLTERLGVTPSLRAAYVRARRLEGWNVSWGLPRPSYVGLMAGSCLAFDWPGQLDDAQRVALQQRVRRVELDGLGERRAEGFGEIAINHPLVSARTSQLSATSGAATASTSPGARVPGPIRKGDAVYDYACAIERAAWRTALRRACMGLAAKQEWRRQTLGWEAKRPSNTQLGALRALLTAARSFDSLKESVAVWLRAIAASANRKESWPERAREALEKVSSDPSMVWGWLTSSRFAELAMTAESKSRLENELRIEAVRCVLLSAIRAEQRQRENAEPRAAQRRAHA